MSPRSLALTRRLLLTAAGILLMAATSSAQATQAEMRAFPMPPTQGFKANKVFTFAGDWGYFLSGSQPVPTPSFVQNSSNLAQDYDYFHYSGIAGKNVYIYGAWGTVPIPAPTVQSGQ